MAENKIRFYYIGESVATDAGLKAYLKAPEDINSRLVLDAENPEYVFVMPFMYFSYKEFDEFKKYYYVNQDSDKSKVFIYLSGEAVEPDFTIFDYSITCYSLFNDGERAFRLHPNNFWLGAKNYINTFTYQDALNKVKNDNLKFCNFIYSNSQAHETRDKLFYKLSEYKRVDSLGPHLNNVNTQGSRNQGNWQQISIELKSNYKFSIAVENAVFRGYTTEKLLTSFQAHTVPIYFGNPKVTEEFNPEAFINFNDFNNDFDALIARVKEIDEDDELWAKIVSTPWQTEQQVKACEENLNNYHDFLRKIFNSHEIMRPMGTLGKWYRNWFFTRQQPISPLELKLRQFAQRTLKSLGLLKHYYALKNKFKNKSR